MECYIIRTHHRSYNSVDSPEHFALVRRWWGDVTPIVWAARWCPGQQDYIEIDAAQFDQRAEWAATEALSNELRDATQLTLRQAQETHTCTTSMTPTTAPGGRMA